MSARKHEKGNPSRSSRRLRLIVFGVILVGAGLLRLNGDIQVVRHYTGQPMFSWGLIAAGIVSVLLAVVPISWVQKAAETGVSQHTSRR